MTRAGTHTHMTEGLPSTVAAAVDEETVLDRAALDGDAIYVTPSRIVLYAEEGLLSDRTVDTYDVGAERVTVSTGRRKTRVTLAYPIDDDRSFSVGTADAEAVLRPVLTGLLSAAVVTDDGERVAHVFRFSELTLAVTDRRLVKHVGEAAWTPEAAVYEFADVTDVRFEPGEVATGVVLDVAGGRERFKVPAEAAREVTERLQSAILDYHDAPSLSAFRAETDTREAAGNADSPADAFESTVDPLDANPPTSGRPDDTAPDDADDSPPSERGTAPDDHPTVTPGGDPEATGERDDAGGADTDTRRNGATDADGAGTDTRRSDATDAEADDDRTLADEMDGEETVLDDEEVTPDAEPGPDAFATPGTRGLDAADVTDLVDTVERLHTAVERQSALVERQRKTLERQQETIEHLVAQVRAIDSDTDDTDGDVDDTDGDPDAAR